MASLPVEILLGVYLGLLVGIIPALISWALGFTFKYVTGVTLPGFGMLVLAIALAGVNGGLLALADPTIMQTPNAPRVVTAILVVAMLALLAHSKGDQMGASFPKRLSFDRLRSERLSQDLAEFIGGDEVRVRVAGEVADMEGYPPLPDDLRAEIRVAELTFPADLRVDELEERMEERLRTEYDLGDVSVSIDERGRATVVAAPPFSGLSKRVAEGRHAVSVAALIPTGLARGDEVTVITPDAQVRGTVVSAQSGRAEEEASEDAVDPAGLEGPDEESDEETAPSPVRAPTTTGGEGRLTVAVTRTDVQPLLRAEEAKVVVESRGTRREYEVVSLLRRADRRFRRFTVRAGDLLDGQPLGKAGLRETYGVAVLAARTADGWTVAPDGTTTLGDGDELFAVGGREALEEFGSALGGAQPRGDD